jgi:hypothetical protein
MERGNLAGSRIASSADVPETSSVASPIVLSMLHWSSGRAAAPFLFHKSRLTDVDPVELPLATPASTHSSSIVVAA